MTDATDNDIADIYRALKHGAGRERVTDGNVRPLIAMAHDHGDAQLEYLLREWVSTCGDDKDLPDLDAARGTVPPSHHEPQ